MRALNIKITAFLLASAVLLNGAPACAQAMMPSIILPQTAKTEDTIKHLFGPGAAAKERAQKLYKNYGAKAQAQKAWQNYSQTLDLAQSSPYYNMPYEEMVKKSKDVNDDIVFLWQMNPSYIKAKRNGSIRKVAVATLAVAAMAAATYAAGSYLVSKGYPLAGELSAYWKLPANPNQAFIVRRQVLETATALSGQGGETLTSAKILRQAQRIVSLRRAAVGVFAVSGIFTADMLFTEETMYAFRETNEKMLLSKSIYKAAKTSNLISKILDDDPVKADIARRKVISKIATGDYNSLTQEELSAVMEENLRLKTALLNLHALEVVRAELSDLKDPYRYDKAVEDLTNIFFSQEDLPVLENREELLTFVKQINKTDEKKIETETDFIRQMSCLTVTIKR